MCRPAVRPINFAKQLGEYEIVFFAPEWGKKHRDGTQAVPYKESLSL